MSTPPSYAHALRGLWDRWGTKVFRYATGSVIAAGCSEVVFVLLYGGVGVTTTIATLFGWLAGAVPNYWLNRSWTWRVQGRPRFLAEVVPYVVIILVTLVTAVLATDAVDHWLSNHHFSHVVDVTLVSATFLGVYGLMFLLRFFLLDRLFAGLGHDETPPAPATALADDVQPAPAMKDLT